MDGIDAGVALLLLIAFIQGAVIGVVAVVSIASRREDWRYSLTGQAPGAMCQGVRRLMGVATWNDSPQAWPRALAGDRHSQGRDQDR